MQPHPPDFPLPKRWTPLRYHAVQSQWIKSATRFNVVPAGRRSGKTELAKRKVVKAALRGTAFDGARFFASAPTYSQAKRIYWQDLKDLVPVQFMAGRPSESELIIPLINGAQIHVLGLDKPQRIEGSPWDGGIVDEIGNAKPDAWGLNIRPALSDRKGWCDLIGVPEGLNHYHDLYLRAISDTSGTWGHFTWPSADILPAEEIEAARRELDLLSFQQEYEASFVNFTGRAYYEFDTIKHCAELKYDPMQPLIVTFDFNVAPGTASIIQEQILPGQYERDKNGAAMLDRPITGTGIIGEVHIPNNSNTPAVCNRIIADWGNHQGAVYVYGDATGGSSGTAKVAGSDWDLIEIALFGHFGSARVHLQNARANPRERARVNAMNTRIMNGSKEIHLMVDPAACPNIVKDFNGVVLLEGGSGEIDKKKTPKLTHLSDGIGYYVEKEFPISGRDLAFMPLTGH